MQRVLHIVGRMDRGGAETMVMNFYRKIDKTKIQFDFVYFTDDNCHFDTEIKQLGGRIFRLGKSNYPNPLSKLFGIIKVIKNNTDISILHTHSLLSSSFHLIAAYIAGLKVRIVHSHNTDDINHRNLLGKFYKNFSIKIINYFATEFLACGHEAGKFLFPNNNRIIELPNSIDTKLFFETSRDKNYLINKFNVNSDTIKIIQVARFANVKNHLFTVNFAKYLKVNGVDFTFFLVGDGSLKENIQKEVKKNGLSEHFRFLGIREDIPALLGGSDIFFMPSLHEGFPVSLVESQSVGIHALISDSISTEVDLGVGLITSLSLKDNLNLWMNKLLNIPNSLITDQQRLKVLEERGFDSVGNTKYLESIYLKNV